MALEMGVDKKSERLELSTMLALGSSSSIRPNSLDRPCFTDSMRFQSFHHKLDDSESNQTENEEEVKA